MQKLALLLTALTFSGSALAADMPVKAPPLAAVPSWTGCYVGGGGGFISFREHHDVLFPAPVIALGGATSISDTTTASGGFGTVQVGCDYGIDRWVIGAFADVDLSRISGEHNSWTFANRGQSYAGGDLTLNSSWAAGGRIGYLVGPTYLVYAAAGFSAAHFGQVNYVYNRFAITGDPTGVVLPATTFNGFFVAAGAEHMLWNGLFIKGEYRFADYGTKNVQQLCTDITICFVAGPTAFTENIHPTVQTVRLELVWKFNSK